MADVAPVTLVREHGAALVALTEFLRGRSATAGSGDFGGPPRAVAGWACALPGADSAAEQVLGEWAPIPVRECAQGVLGHRRRARTEQEYTVKSR